MSQSAAMNRLLVSAMLLGLVAAGCGKSGEPSPNGSAAARNASGTGQALRGGAALGRPVSELSESERIDLVIEALHPVQRIVGTWRGTTQKEYGGFKAVEMQQWIWDFQSEPLQPALVMNAEQSPYLRSGRLTYLLDSGVYRFTAVDSKGASRVFQSAAPAALSPAVQSADASLVLAESSPASDSDAWQLKLTLTGDDQFSIELSHNQPGKPLAWFDTVVAQREAGSAAPEGTGSVPNACIISQSPATIEVQYRGESYWVCCAGCRNAFEQDPERWIARMAQRERKSASRISRR